MDVTAGVKESIAIAAVVGGLVFFGLMIWIGGELRYGNCLDEVELRHPVVLSGAESAAEAAAREDEISDCSRWF